MVDSLFILRPGEKLLIPRLPYGQAHLIELPDLGHGLISSLLHFGGTCTLPFMSLWPARRLSMILSHGDRRNYCVDFLIRYHGHVRQCLPHTLKERLFVFGQCFYSSVGSPCTFQVLSTRRVTGRLQVVVTHAGETNAFLIILRLGMRGLIFGQRMSQKGRGFALRSFAFRSLTVQDSPDRGDGRVPTAAPQDFQNNGLSEEVSVVRRQGPNDNMPKM